jgi:hypothetical protein
VNKKIFKANKKKRSGSGSSGFADGSLQTPHAANNTLNSQRGPKPVKCWAPPTDEEKKNQNHHTIDGKLYYFHNNAKHWVPVNASGALSSGPSTIVANAAVANTVTSSVQAGSVTPVTLNQTHDVAVANATRQIEMTFQGLCTSLAIVPIRLVHTVQQGYSKGKSSHF